MSISNAIFAFSMAVVNENGKIFIQDRGLPDFTGYLFILGEMMKRSRLSLKIFL